MNNELIKKVTDIIKANVDGTEEMNIAPDTMLITGGYIDSFDIVSLISVLESEFNITLPFDDLDLEDFDTVSSIAGIIESKLSN